MRFLADLHIHSRYSRATSPSQTLADLALWAGRKGIDVLATGDATHPAWRAELREELEPCGEGILKLRRGGARTLFILQGEVSCIYKEGGRTRKVHVLNYFPTFDGLEAFCAALGEHTDLGSDGRPITKLSARRVFELLLEKAPGGQLIPAHVWTPWFSLLGEKSGYDSVEEAFGDLAPLIPALETGLSADPAMCRSVSSLDPFGLISSSDAHSPPMLGREASEFDLAPGFGEIFRSLRPGQPGFISTVEFFPEMGKYHVEGHRKCDVRMGVGGLCPVCGKPLTGGVLPRVEALADRAMGIPDRPFVKLIPLPLLLAEALGKGAASKKVQAEYLRLIDELGPELYILRSAAPADLAAAHSPELAALVGAVREGKVEIEPGYDGRYGRVLT